MNINGRRKWQERRDKLPYVCSWFLMLLVLDDALLSFYTEGIDETFENPLCIIVARVAARGFFFSSRNHPKIVEVKSRTGLTRWVIVMNVKCTCVIGMIVIFTNKEFLLILTGNIPLCTMVSMNIHDKYTQRLSVSPTNQDQNPHHRHQKKKHTRTKQMTMKWTQRQWQNDIFLLYKLYKYKSNQTWMYSEA